MIDSSEGPTGAAWCAADLPEPRVAWTSEAGPTLTLTELWSAGGDDEHALVRPGRPAVRDDGTVAVPDPGGSAVLVRDPRGPFFRPVASEGDGPGEVRWPVEVAWNAEGRLLVFDLATGRVTTLVVDGSASPAAEIATEVATEYRVPSDVLAAVSAAGQLPGVDLLPDGNVLLEMPWRLRAAGGRSAATVLLRVGPHDRVDTVATFHADVVGAPDFETWPAPGGRRPVYAGGPDGRIALAGRDARYRVEVRGPEQVLVVCRDADPLPLTPSESGESFDGSVPPALAEAIRAGPAPDPLMPLGDVFIDRSGRLWILRDRRDPLTTSGPAEGGTYDLFGPGGELIGHVEAPRGVVLSDGRGARVYGTRRNELDVVTVVAFRLSPPAG